MAEYFVPQKRKKYYKNRKINLETECKKLYRFEMIHIDWMANYFLDKSDEKRGGALSNLQKMKIFLRFCADPGFQNGIAEEVGVHQTTVSRTILEMASIISRKAREWIKFPNTVEKINNAQMEWQEKYCFPFAIGVIDCTHIKIKKPKEQSDEYVCRKGFHSINVQATCNGNEFFTSIDVSWPGSVHDSRILRNSEIYRTMNNAPNNALLLGDEGYALSPWLMVPYRNPQNETELNFNKVFTKERCIIERCFGQLKQRFPILQYKIRVSTDIAPKVIASCFVLHNIAKFLKDDFEIHDEVPRDFWNLEMNYTAATDSRVSAVGKTKRNSIANLLM